MGRTIVILRLTILLIGGAFILLETLSQGNGLMTGILDRLRQSYPYRSGKELDQTLNALP